MKRFAAHFVFYRQALPLHYVEIRSGRFAGTYPLTEEIAGTAFFDGILLPVPPSIDKEILDAALLHLHSEALKLSWENISTLLYIGKAEPLEAQPVRLFLLDPHRYSSSELRTDD